MFGSGGKSLAHDFKHMPVGPQPRNSVLRPPFIIIIIYTNNYFIISPPFDCPYPGKFRTISRTLVFCVIFIQWIIPSVIRKLLCNLLLFCANCH